MAHEKMGWLKFSGAGSSMPDSFFDPDQLAIGIEVEMEHTSDRRIAKMIAKDHLAEFENYYMFLTSMERELEMGKKIKETFGW